MSQEDDPLDAALAFAAILAAALTNVLRVSENIRKQRAEGREATPEELALEQAVTAQKRALAEAS